MSSQTPKRRARPILLGGSALCAVGLFVLMANEAQLPHGALVGFVLLCGVVLGLLSVLGLLAPGDDDVPLSETSFYPLPDEPRWAAPKVTVPLAFAAWLLPVLMFGFAALPYAIVCALLLLFVSALRRPALLVFVACSALYLPMLGVYGLWDPWETHYGEVAREILSRDDWISLWWAQDKWFWSKPILIFWSEALTWSASGLDFRPDTNPDHTEWVLRLPIFTMAMAGLMAVYATVARVWSPRAGVVSALVLATTPYYAFLSHQSITDMPFVANMTVAVMLLVLGLVEDPERVARRVRIGPISLSLQHAVLALVVMISLPQIVYLATRNVTFMGGLFAWHKDYFFFGSAGNADVPGNFGWRQERPYAQALYAQPMAQALYWLVGLAWIVRAVRREARVQQLCMFAFYVFCALAFMGKGIPGFALPGLAALLALIATGRFSLLLEGKLRVSLGMLIILVLGMPWFVAMFMRHGTGFTDRLLVHDHINRLTSGVHGDTGSVQYFIWQLGYGLFPWIALLPAALGSWLVTRSAARAHADDAAARRQLDALYVIGLWFAASFTLFSAMTTKFHHYIFPAVPPAAVLTGLLVDRMLGETRAAPKLRELLPLVAALIAPALCVLGFAGLYGDPRGVIPEDVAAAARSTWILQHGYSISASVALLAAGLIAFVLALRTALARGELDADGFASRASHMALGSMLIAGAAIATFVGRDMSWHLDQGPPGSTRLIHLFVYNYNRPWPDYLDYRPIFTGFSITFVLLIVLCTVRLLRKTAARALLGLACVFTLFCLDVYMIDLSPHWGQRELIKRYYADRKDASESLVAWQMNWKGENYYTGNRVAVFVDLDNKKIQAWMKDNGGKRAFFVLEHGRLDRFKRLLSPTQVEVLTDKRDCNKFVLVSAELPVVAPEEKPVKPSVRPSAKPESSGEAEEDPAARP